MKALLQLLLSALLPLLERRTAAAEREAAALERLEDLARTYLSYADPDFLRLLQGEVPGADADSAEVDVDYDSGAARDLKAARLEELRALWYQKHGELLDDERLWTEYQRLYEESDRRLNADQEAGVQ